MSLKHDVFIKLSFHAKMHKLLDYAHTYNEKQEQDHDKIVHEEFLSRVERQIDTTIEKIEKKELAEHTDELAGLKQITVDLRKEFNAMRE